MQNFELIPLSIPTPSKLVFISDVPKALYCMLLYYNYLSPFLAYILSHFQFLFLKVTNIVFVDLCFLIKSRTIWKQAVVCNAESNRNKVIYSCKKAVSVSVSDSCLKMKIEELIIYMQLNNLMPSGLRTMKNAQNGSQVRV